MTEECRALEGEVIGIFTVKLVLEKFRFPVSLVGKIEQATLFAVVSQEAYVSDSAVFCVIYLPFHKSHFYQK